MLRRLCAAVLFFVFGLGNSQGQPNPSAPEPYDTIELPNEATGSAVDSESGPALVLDDVVVTATRAGDSLRDTPISVSVTSETELRETDIRDIEGLSDRLPNAQLALTPTNTFLFVRGLGTGSVRSAEQSVGFFVDGVFLGRPQVALFEFLDVDQVELLRGPQGAILGKNTVAGALNVRSAPTTNIPEGYIEALSGSNGRQRIRAAASGSITETVAARVAYAGTKEDGFLVNTTLARTDLARPGESGRVKFSWSPSDEQSYELAVQAAKIRQRGDSFELSQASDETLGIYRLFDPETEADSTDFRTHTDHEQSAALIEGADIFFNAEWNLPLGRLRFIGGLTEQDVTTDYDVDVSPAPFLTLPSIERYQQQSGEIRLDTSFNWGELSVGLYYFEADLDLDVDITVFANGAGDFIAPLIDQSTGLPLGNALEVALGDLAPALGVVSEFGFPSVGGLGRGVSSHSLVQKTRTLSTFGSAKWSIGERSVLRFDLRFSRETKDGVQELMFEGVTGRALGEALGEQEYSLQAKRVETDFSPRISALTELSRGVSGYITVGRGFKSGGLNNLAAVPERAEFDAEESLTYEAGLRARTKFGLRGSFGIFHTRFDNLQVAALDGTEFFVGNAAQAQTQGAELSFDWYFPGGFVTGGDLGYLDAEYLEYTNAPSRADQDESSQDLSGRVLQRAPRWSGNLRLGWGGTMPGIDLPISMGLVAEGASKHFLNIDLDPIDSQAGYVRYNGFIGVEDRSGHLNLRLIGRNLSNRVIRREAADIAIVGAHFVGVYPPRTFAVEIGWRF